MRKGEGDARLLHVADVDAHFLHLRRAIGPPWNNDHKLAMAAAIVTAALSEHQIGTRDDAALQLLGEA